MQGVQVGLLNLAYQRMSGVQIASANAAWEGEMRGVQIGLFNGAKILSGVHLGALNYAGTVRGVQIGLLNLADTLEGLQIGGLNIAVHGAVFPLMPLVNFHATL